MEVCCYCGKPVDKVKRAYSYNTQAPFTHFRVTLQVFHSFGECLKQELRFQGVENDCNGNA